MVRLREDLRITTEDGCDLTLRARLHRAGRTRFFQARLGARDAAGTCDAPLLAFVATRLKTEWLIVLSSIPGRQALPAYRKRWAIECMFGDAKTRGLNIAQSWFRLGFDHFRNLIASDHSHAVRPWRTLQIQGPVTPIPRGVV